MDHQRRSAPVRVMLVDDHPQRANMVAQRLADTGFEVVCSLPTASGLLFQIEQHQPDVIIVDLRSPDRDVLESLSIVNAHNPTPIVMFSEEEDPDFINHATEAGVTAYQVDGLNPAKVKPIIDVAMAQFRAFQSLRNELREAQMKLEDRKVIERARGLLMAHNKLSEEAAFAALRGLAMDSNRRIAEVAREVVERLSQPSRRRDYP